MLVRNILTAIGIIIMSLIMEVLIWKKKIL
jgi:hypothetical protein